MRWAVAGYGDVVVRRALPALRAAGHEVVGVCGRDPGRARAVAARFGLPIGTSTLGELLGSADAAYVATPVASHVPLSLAAVRAGRHVLVEKPVAAALGGGDELAVAAARSGVRVAVAYYRRLAPALGLLRAFVTRLPPGAVHRAVVRFQAGFDPAPDDPMHWRTDRAVSGGGVLADAGAHRLDLLCWLFGPPDTVSARFADFHPGGAERSARATLTWPHGLTADVWCQWSRDGRQADFFRLDGDGWAVAADPLDGGRLRWRGAAGAAVLDRAPAHADTHARLFADFAAAVETGAAPACPLADGLLVDNLIVAAGRSHARGGAPCRLPAGPG